VTSHDDLHPDVITLTDEDHRLTASWAADCAERVLPLFEAKAPSDARPRDAIAGARAYTLDGKRTKHLRTVSLAAHAAAREVGDPVATAAARAAGCAAATPYTHALATPHQSKHVLGPAVYAALAREASAGNDTAVGDEELEWAIRQASPLVCEVVRRFPPRSPGRTRLATLFCRLDASLRCRAFLNLLEVTSLTAEAASFFYAAGAACRASPALRMLRAACSSAGAASPQR
jgi:hypothetical protein